MPVTRCSVTSSPMASSSDHRMPRTTGLQLAPRIDKHESHDTFTMVSMAAKDIREARESQCNESL
jgi:hypothetical protein